MEEKKPETLREDHDTKLGKRHVPDGDGEPKMEVKAAQIGFSFSEIRHLRQLYERHLKPRKK